MGNQARGVQGVQGCLGRGFQGGSRGAPGGSRGFVLKTRKNKKNAPELWIAHYAATSRILCSSSRPNGSGYPLSVPAVAHPPPFLNC